MFSKEIENAPIVGLGNSLISVKFSVIEEVFKDLFQQINSIAVEESMVKQLKYTVYPAIFPYGISNAFGLTWQTNNAIVIGSCYEEYFFSPEGKDKLYSMDKLLKFKSDSEILNIYLVTFTVEKNNRIVGKLNKYKGETKYYRNHSFAEIWYENLKFKFDFPLEVIEQITSIEIEAVD